MGINFTIVELIIEKIVVIDDADSTNTVFVEDSRRSLKIIAVFAAATNQPSSVSLHIKLLTSRRLCWVDRVILSNSPFQHPWK